jgi:hypothetical protein
LRLFTTYYNIKIDTTKHAKQNWADNCVTQACQIRLERNQGRLLTSEEGKQAQDFVDVHSR